MVSFAHFQTKDSLEIKFLFDNDDFPSKQLFLIESIPNKNPKKRETNHKESLTGIVAKTHYCS